MAKILNSGYAAGIAILFAATLARAGTLGTVTANGFTFTNFDFPNSGTIGGAGTNANGISNTGVAVGFSIDNTNAFTNFVRNTDGTFTQLNTPNTQAMAFGVNSAGDVVGEANNAAFLLPPGGSPQTLATPPAATAAFGIDDLGNIVGQYSTGGLTPGFFLANSSANGFVRIDAPAGPDVVNAQGVNDHGLAVGFYVGTDGQVHGFQANTQNATNGQITGTPIADPTIPNVAGEPGATFVFSQILGINDNGLAVGYYGDSTTSQHGFLYNTITGQYMFLDDPAEAFNNGVEVTQITGINNAGELAGFYSDAGGVFHGFVACAVGSTCTGQSAVPEPVSGLLGACGLALLGIGYSRRQRNA
jgi:hypothetical protein